MTIEETLQALLTRNARVEAEKAWEVSITRRLSIAALTYATAAILLWLTHQENVLFLALVPTAGYVLSTLSLPWIKRRWMEKHRR